MTKKIDLPRAISRRGLMRRSAVVGAAFSAPGFIIGHKSAMAEELGEYDPNSLFHLGVASGDPQADGIILWTRINPLHFSRDKELKVFVWPAGSPRPTNAVKVEGQANDPNSWAPNPQRDYTAKFDFSGLNSNTRYAYQFKYGDKQSPTGYFRTLALPGESMAGHESLAVLTCQDYTTGYFRSLQHLTNLKDLACVVHVGDFIYEYAEYVGFQNSVLPGRGLVLPSGGLFAESRKDFRHIYRTYRTDPHLRAAMAAHAWIITWDDHEIGDNSSFSYVTNAPNLGFHASQPHPLALSNEDWKILGEEYPHIPDEFQAKIGRLKTQRLAAQDAWEEYVPARVATAPRGHTHAASPITYRSFKFGDRFKLVMTDSRSYRSKEPCTYKPWTTCYDYRKKDYKPDPSLIAPFADTAPQTMLGKEQLAWFKEQIKDDDCTWQVWGNQTLLSQFLVTSTLVTDRAQKYGNYDAWDGYQHERHEILRELYHSKQTPNLVVLTGDMHTAIASEVRVNPTSDAADSDYHPGNKAGDFKVMGIEIMTPSVTSPNMQDNIQSPVSGDYLKGLSPSVAAGLTDNVGEFFKWMNPNIKAIYGDLYGFSTVKLGEEVMDWSIYHFDKRSAGIGNPERVINHSWNPKEKKLS